MQGNLQEIFKFLKIINLSIHLKLIIFSLNPGQFNKIT
jgi:hypothetical protein